MQQLTDINWRSWQAKETATLTFVVKDEQVLLIRKKRGLGAGKVNAPGGRQEPGESLLECAVREVQEELCVTPLELTYGGENRFQFMDGYSIHVHAYLARDYTGTPQETDEAIPLWFSLPQIPYAEMWADDILWVPHLLAAEPFSGCFLFDGDRMVDCRLDLVGSHHCMT